MNDKKIIIVEVMALVYLPGKLINKADLPSGKMSALRIKTEIKKGSNSGESFYIYDHRPKIITYSNNSSYSLKTLVNSRARVVVMKKGNGSKYINLFEPQTDNKIVIIKKTDIALREIIFPLETKRQKKLIWSVGGYFSDQYYMIALEKILTKEKEDFSKINYSPVPQPV
jgi:hypothetical protein